MLPVTEHALERLVSRTLALGVIASGACMLAGFLVYMFQPSLWNSAMPDPARMLALPAGALLLRPAAWLYLGILLLMFTPVIRVVITTAGFALQRDWRFVTISAIVLIVIVFSIVLSIVT